MTQMSAPATVSRSGGLERFQEAITAAERLLHHVKSAVRGQVAAAGGLDAAQSAAHGLAWFATYVEALRQMLAWATRLEEAGRFGEMERLLVAAAFGEYLAQLAGGIPMSQGETVRAVALGVAQSEVRRFEDAVADLVAEGCAEPTKRRLAELIAEQPAVTTFGDTGLDETLSEMRVQMRRFSEAEVLPYAHEWHLSNSYIPSRSPGEARRARRLRPHPAGGVRRPRARQGGDVRRLRRALARLYRRGLARNAFGDRGRIDPGRRHRGAEAEIPAQDRIGRDCCRRPFSPNRTPAPISPRSRRAPSARATSTR